MEMSGLLGQVCVVLWCGNGGALSVCTRTYVMNLEGDILRLRLFICQFGWAQVFRVRGSVVGFTVSWVLAGFHADSLRVHWEGGGAYSRGHIP